MKGDHLPPEAHVLRYIRGSQIQGETINGGGFLETYMNGPSVNWVEVFEPPLENQVSRVRQLRRIEYGATGRLALVNVGNVREHVTANAADVIIDVVHDPLPEMVAYAEDPSHCLMHGVPLRDTPEGELVGDLIAECIIESFPAKPPG